MIENMILRDSGKRIFSNDTVSTENHLSKNSLTQEAPCAITTAASVSLKMRFYGSHSTKGQKYPLLFPRPRLMMLTNCSSESFCISDQFPKKSFSEKKVFGRGGQTFFGISILPSDHDLRNFSMTAEIAVNHHPYSLTSSASLLSPHVFEGQEDDNPRTCYFRDASRWFPNPAGS